MATHTEETTLLDRIDAVAPIREFDAFPKVAQTYYTRTPLGGLATVLVIIMSFLLSLNDVGEFLWGWPDYEFSVDSRLRSTMNINLDMVVNMPCAYLSIDVRDAVGDRLHLTNSFTRDGTTFDARQAHTLHSHGVQKSTREIVTAARKKSGGLFAAFKSQSSSYRPTYSHHPSQSACRIFGTVEVKRVTGNLHITSLGHGYSSHEHTDHRLMNFTHVLTELSFGPYFPNIVQPLDYTLEVADDPFTRVQYFLTVVPTVYRAPRSASLRTNQYSATSYRHTIEHGRGTPGIFFKFEIDPMEMTIWQRTTTLSQFLLRLCGVVGGVWVCAGWAVKVAMRAATVVGVGKDDDGTIVGEVESTASRKNASQRWGSPDLRPRASGPGWTVDGGVPPVPTSPYTPYSNKPLGAVNGYAIGAGRTPSPNRVGVQQSPPSSANPPPPYANGLVSSQIGQGDSVPYMPPSPNMYGTGSPASSLRPKPSARSLVEKRID